MWPCDLSLAAPLHHILATITYLSCMYSVESEDDAQVEGEKTGAGLWLAVLGPSAITRFSV